MCVAIPAKIVEIDHDGGGNDAVVDIEGVRRPANLMLVVDANVGDYVILHAGFAITVIDEAEAEKSLAIFREMGAFRQ